MSTGMPGQDRFLGFSMSCNKNKNNKNLGCFSKSSSEGVEELREKEKGLMDMDHSVVMAGGRAYKGTKW